MVSVGTLTVVSPLTNLLSLSQGFVWSEECQWAFEAIKTLQCSSPVLSAPDFRKPFKLEVDASALGAGAVLIQGDTAGLGVSLSRPSPGILL